MWERTRLFFAARGLVPLPGALSVWNMILLMMFFRNVPKDLEKAALIDGANHAQALWSIYLPISLPAIATLSLFRLVGHWNSWFDCMIYMTRPEHFPLGTYLQKILVQTIRHSVARRLSVSPTVFRQGHR